MEIDFLKFGLIILIGIVAGFFNTVAGGGSLLSLPVLIMYVGLSPSVANATNRVAIFSQNIFAVAGFKSKGIGDFKYGMMLGGSALIGAIIGAQIAVDIKGDLFNKILAIIMILVIVETLFKNKSKNQDQFEKTDLKHKVLGVISFFFVGIYGGFIQAGVGFIIIAVLTNINGFTLVKTNAIKVLVVLIYTLAALVVFIAEGQVNWIYGITLAMGNSAGAWFASRWSVDKGDKVLRRILIIAVFILAVKLWFF